MTVFHYFQVVFAFGVAIVVVRLLIKFLRGISVDAPAFSLILQASVQAQDENQIKVVCDVGREAWINQLASSGLRARKQGLDAGLRMAQIFREIRDSINSGLRILRVLARTSIFVGLLCALGEIFRLQIGSFELAALMHGVAEQEVGENAMLSIAIGFATSAFALMTRGQLRKTAMTILKDCNNLRERLENLLESPNFGDWTPSLIE